MMINSDSEDSADGSCRDYSESSMYASDKDLGPETPRPNEIGDFVEFPVAWVPTFKERVGKTIGRFLNDSKTFCVSGKMKAPPIMSISLLKANKCISFPLFEDMLDSIMPASEQPRNGHGRGKKIAVDKKNRNSWDLSCKDFEIMNTDWDSYLIDVLVPLLQHDLRLEVGFRLSLYKLMLYKAGSFFKQHRDSEKENGMFGTVVIQLPSFYKGGKLIVRHNHKTEEVDTSSATTSQNRFSTFYTAFYSDCEHEVLPITSGVRACLVYNLILTGETQADSIPSATRLEHENRETDLVDLLQNSWSTGRKLVYCLAHKYSLKSLSLDNLKSSDRLLGQLFLKYADSCGYKVLIGVIKRKKYRYAREVYKPKELSPRSSPEIHRKYQYNDDTGYQHFNQHVSYDYDDDEEEIATISDVDSNDPDVRFYNQYKIKKLKSLDENHLTTLPSLSVNFESEVLPENCFQDVKAYHEDHTGSGNDGVRCSKFYQCAAIVLYRHDDLVPILVQGEASLAKIEETFLKEFRKQRANLTNEIKEKYVKWSHVTIDKFLSPLYHGKEMRNMSEMFECLLLLDNIEVLQKFLKIQKFEFEMGNFSYVYRMCQKHGWKTFSAELIMRLGKLTPERKIVILMRFVDYKNAAAQYDTEWLTIIHSLLEEMLTKFEHELKHPSRFSPKPLKKGQITKKTKNFLIKLWPLATKVNFQPFVAYATSKPMNIVVPALISIAESKENIANGLWMEVATHFKSQMEIILNALVDLPMEMPTWNLNVKLNCRCKYCLYVEGYLNDDDNQAVMLAPTKTNRDHVQQEVAGLENLTITTLKTGLLRIKKLRRIGEAQYNAKKFVSANLPKLSSFMADAE